MHKAEDEDVPGLTAGGGNLNAEEDEQTGVKALIKKVDLKRGDVCCYLIYRAVEDHSPKATELIKNLPKFVETASIERAATFKASR